MATLYQPTSTTGKAQRTKEYSGAQKKRRRRRAKQSHRVVHSRIH